MVFPKLLLQLLLISFLSIEIMGQDDYARVEITEGYAKQLLQHIAVSQFTSLDDILKLTPWDEVVKEIKFSKLKHLMPSLELNDELHIDVTWLGFKNKFDLSFSDNKATL